MSESNSKKRTILLSLFPVLIIFFIDTFTMFLQSQEKVISHLNISLLIAQLICFLVFTKGEICNGQRSRLVNINLYLLIYWILWILLSLFSNYHYVLTDIVSLCGIGSSLAIWLQPKDPHMRKSILMIGSLLSVLGIIVSLFIFIELPIYYIIDYNPINQLLTGIILANLMLVISKNRLQGLIALFPVGILISLFLNALLITMMIGYFYWNGVSFVNEFSWGIYFLCHLLVVSSIAIHILKKWKLEYVTLILLLFITACLPIWSIFSRIN